MHLGCSPIYLTNPCLPERIHPGRDFRRHQHGAAHSRWVAPGHLPAGPAQGEFISASQLVFFYLFWALHIYFIWNGIESIRKLEVVAALLMLIASLARFRTVC